MFIIKIIRYVICLLGLLCLLGCTKSVNDLPLTALDVYERFKDEGLEVGDYVSYTKETDPNRLLGTKNQYIDKINFEITTLEQYDPDTLRGGSIEIFSNKKDAESRKAYIDEIGMQVPMFAEYSYIVKDVILIRINRSVESEEAAKYPAVIE